MICPVHPEHDATPTPNEIEFMAAALEGRHGSHAASVADFLSSAHSLEGDAGRCWAWAGVADLVRKREKSRINEKL
ncbi:MAG: hypothetical protein ACRBCJ_11320 [Hyphomicrobiaceae bacterium]